ncbi:lipopolysaccharide transport periplasmic protein LptA [Desulfogranum japonicum]|uniref:lipopolysaccharide transport periplasmic protein LptA n=1 Tax=Desulfogranum japonicum TaxID=231447 RepID=UPI0004220EB7|nr:lipopolysaccharide transport periplasmic protein LptA [Desulfogranum japonicum]
MYMHKKNSTRQLVAMLLVFFTIGILPVKNWAAENDEPIFIEADRMISQETENSVVFLGNVDAKQGNVTIRSDEMTVFYTQTKAGNKKGKGSSNQVKRLICKKNVEVVQDDWLGTGERMDYFAKERKVILSGNAKAWQGQNMVSGKTITYYLDEKRSIVEQDTTKQGRVKATLHPDSDTKQ